MIIPAGGAWPLRGSLLLTGNGYSLTVVTPPSDEPVSLAQAKKHLRVDGSDEDAYIGALIASARHTAERTSGRQVMAATLAFTMDAFPYEIRLPRPPVSAVSSIKYFDTAGVEQTLDPALYQVDLKSTPARIRAAYSKVWPCPRPQIGAVTVEYVAGAANAAAADPMLVQAIYLIIGHWYQNREQVVVGSVVNVLPMGADELLLGRRVPMVF